MSYEDWQLQKIRDTILAFQSLNVDSKGDKYSWSSLAEDIEEVTGVKIPKERLRKFVMGEPCRKSDKTPLKTYHYPSLNAERLEAVIAFLTNEGSDSYMFSRKDLEIKPSGLSAILQFAEHLNRNRHSTRMTNASNLSGNFIADQNPTDISTATTLRLRKANHNGLVPLILLKEYADGIEISESSDQSEKINHSFDRYEGWAVITPEEAIIFLSKNSENNENLIYVTLGIDKASYLSQPVNAFVLLEIDQPEDRILVQLDMANAYDMLRDVKEAFAQKLLLFKREKVDS